MLERAVTDPCSLCAAASVYTTMTDEGNSRFYDCRAIECGDYEIRKQAMSHLQYAKELKRLCSAEAHEEDCVAR